MIKGEIMKIAVGISGGVDSSVAAWLLKKEGHEVVGIDLDKKMLATHYYHECSRCGYSPELDYQKTKYKKCHEEYTAWSKNKKR